MKRAISLTQWLFVASAFFLFASCEKDHREDSPVIEKEINLTGFARVYALDKFTVTITKGNNFSIKVKGPSNDVNDIDFKLTSGNTLDIQYRTYYRKRPAITIVITMPDLLSVVLAGAANATVNGFGGQNHVMRTILSGASKCIVNGTGINAQVEASGASVLTINGATASLYGSISGASKLMAYDLAADEVDIDVSGASHAWVKVQSSLFAVASGGSKIYYKGNPGQKHTEATGGSLIIQE
jgi:hypothetical protein